jgi:hypothetical protein
MTSEEPHCQVYPPMPNPEVLQALWYGKGANSRSLPFIIRRLNECGGEVDDLIRNRSDGRF